MTAILIDGKVIAKKIRDSITKEVKKMKTRPKLAVILIGEHKPSLTYIRKKQEAAQEVGIEFELFKYPKNISKDKLVENIYEIQMNNLLDGLILQLPVPDKLYVPEVLNSIDPDIDVDCLTDFNIGKLVMDTQLISPPTPNAVIHILKKELKLNLKGKKITLVGAGALVGKPLSIMLLNEQATVTVCNSETENIKKHCLESEIIVSGVGKKDLIRGEMIKKGAIVIDTGIVFENGKMYGDANKEEMLKKASYFTPTPGGVGPITVALLLQNTLLCSKRKNIKIL